MKFETCRPGAQTPKYGSQRAAGVDFYSPVDKWIWPKCKVVIPTGIKLQIPEWFFLKIESRSGTSVKNSIETGAGVIDQDYRKEISIVLHNHGWWPYKVKAGDRIAQGVFQKHYYFSFLPGKIDENDRGGFGSTGR